MGELSHALDFLLDVLYEVGLLGKLFLVDALNGVDLIIGRFEFDFLGRKHIRKGPFSQFF